MDLNELYLDAFGGDKSDSDDVIPSELDTDDDENEIAEEFTAEALKTPAEGGNVDFSDSPEENEDDE